MTSREVLENHVNCFYRARLGRDPKTDKEAIEIMKQRLGDGTVYGRGMCNLSPVEQDSFEREVLEYLYLVHEGCAV